MVCTHACFVKLVGHVSASLQYKRIAPEGIQAKPYIHKYRCRTFAHA